MEDTLDIVEAADFLKVDDETARKLAATGEIFGAKVGRGWVFLRSDLVDYLRKITREQTEKRRAERDDSPKLVRENPPERVKKKCRTLPVLPELPGEMASA